MRPDPSWLDRAIDFGISQGQYTEQSRSRVVYEAIHSPALYRDLWLLASYIEETSRVKT